MAQPQLTEEQLSEINQNIIEEAVDHIMSNTQTNKDIDEITVEHIKKMLVETFGIENITEQIIKDNIVAYYIWRRTTRYRNYDETTENH